MLRDSDADVTALVGRRVAVIGYGDLGRPYALNLRDSGVPALIGNQDDEFAKQAAADGFPIYPIAEAAAHADTLLLMLPDELLASIYAAHIAPYLTPGMALVFASGYCVTFGFIEPPPFVDLLLIAPRTIGAGVREGYQNGGGYLSFLAVEQDATGKAWPLTLALAQALGALRMGALELTFRQEAELDLFVQQAFLPALHNLLISAADVLLAEGYPPEAALLDLYMSGEIGYTLNKAAQQGLLDTLRMYSLTAQYGMLSRADRFADPRLRRQMEAALDDIRSGKFAAEWADEFANDYPRLKALRAKRERLTLWELEQQVIQALQQPLPEVPEDVDP